MTKDGRHVYARHRLYVNASLGAGQAVSLSRNHAHYLVNVLRMGQGDAVLLFNGQDGEWLARLDGVSKRAATATLEHQTRPQTTGPDLWLLFAPLKKSATDFLVEKAVELGASRLAPVITRYTNSTRVRTDRLAAQVAEAAEQCERLTVPDVAGPRPLDQLLADWPADRALYFANEHLTGGAPLAALAENAPDRYAAILIGPEGGFSASEAGNITALAATRPVWLGPRILRADTAAVALLTLWQASRGDWA